MQQCDDCGERSLNVDNGPYPHGSIRLQGGTVLRGGLYPVRAVKRLICGECALRQERCLVGDQCNHQQLAEDRLRCRGCDTKLCCGGCEVYFVQIMQMTCPICRHCRNPTSAPEWMHERIAWANGKKEASHHKTQ